VKHTQLDAVIHAPVRLAILSVLVSVTEADFNYLKNITGATDGNLSTHLSKLEQKEYVKIEKVFKGKKPATICRITRQGRDAFSKYLKALEDVIHFPGQETGVKSSETKV
jgi:DNA-binding transcriptional ArsR family regulator